MSVKVSSAASIVSSTGSGMPVTPKRKSKGSRKGGGLFGCRSKSALDSLPRNARGSGAAINRLQAQHVFQDEETKSNSCASPSSTAWTNANPFELVVAKDQMQTSTDEAEEDEARDVLTDSVNPALNSCGPGATRSNSISGAGTKFRRSLSLKRSGSTASTNLAQRAPPVSSTDFAPNDDAAPSVPEHVNDMDTDKAPAHLKGDMASIRQARGQHLSASAAAASSQNLFPDITEDEYIGLAEVPVPPSFIPIPSLPPVSPTTAPAESPAVRMHAQRPSAVAVHSALSGSESMRAVALALGDDTTYYSHDKDLTYQPGPSTGTPRLQTGSPTTTASIAELDRRHSTYENDAIGQDTLPKSAPAASGTFWDDHTEKESCSDRSANAKFVPFQYMTNLTRPVSIASFRSLASPHTPPRTSSRNAIQNRPSFSPLASQGTFNGFPAGYFPKLATMGGTAASPLKEKENMADTSMEDVEAQLGLGDEPNNEFAQFAAKGKASRRTTIKKTTALASPLADIHDIDELTASASPVSVELSAPQQKKMVPGPAGRYITDTANMRWCSAMDEIKKALASTNEDEDDEIPADSAHDVPTDQSGVQIDKLENHIDELLEEADAVLTKLGVETH